MCETDRWFRHLRGIVVCHADHLFSMEMRAPAKSLEISWIQTFVSTLLTALTKLSSWEFVRPPRKQLPERERKTNLMPQSKTVILRRGRLRRPQQYDAIWCPKDNICPGCDSSVRMIPIDVSQSIQSQASHSMYSVSSSSPLQIDIKSYHACEET